MPAFIIAALLAAEPASAQTNLGEVDAEVKALETLSTEWAEAARKARSFPFPARPVPWPCEVADRDLRRAAGTLALDELPPEERRTRILEYRNAGMGGQVSTSYKPLRAHLVSGTCQNGRLHGPVEYLTSHDVVEDMLHGTVRYRMHQRVAATFIDGTVDPASPVTVAQISEDMRTTLKNGDTSDDAMTAFMGMAREMAQPYKGADAFTHIILFNGKQTNVSTVVGTPQPDGRTLHVMYQGKRKALQYFRRNGLHHGIWETFPQTVGSHTVPGQRKCYVEGRELKTETCEAK